MVTLLLGHRIDTWHVRRSCGHQVGLLFFLPTQSWMLIPTRKTWIVVNNMFCLQWKIKTLVMISCNLFKLTWNRKHTTDNLTLTNIPFAVWMAFFLVALNTPSLSRKVCITRKMSSQNKALNIKVFYTQWSSTSKAIFQTNMVLIVTPSN